MPKRCGGAGVQVREGEVALRPESGASEVVGAVFSGVAGQFRERRGISVVELGVEFVSGGLEEAQYGAAELRFVAVAFPGESEGCLGIRLEVMQMAYRAAQPGGRKHAEDLRGFEAFREAGRERPRRDAIREYMKGDLPSEGLVMFDGHRLISGSGTLEYARVGYDSKCRFLPQVNLLYMFSVRGLAKLPVCHSCGTLFFAQIEFVGHWQHLSLYNSPC